MAYVKITNFAIKDSTNDVIRGTEHDDEYNAIAVAVGLNALKGANSDITSLSGLTTALSITQGGTDATTASGARTNLSAVAYTTTTGSAVLPASTTANRDASPAAGYLRFNTTNTTFEGYNGTAWGSVLTDVSITAYTPYGLFYKQTTSSVAFTKTGAGTATTSQDIKVEIAGTVYSYTSGATVVMPTLTAGTDYAIYVCTDGTVRADSSFTAPSGYTVGNSRQIGGFHYAPGGNAAAQAGGDTTAAINAYSFWDLKFRPACSDPRGMALVAGSFWTDIYLLGVDYLTNGSSKYNVSIADGSAPPKRSTLYGGNGTTTYADGNWWNLAEALRHVGKRHPTYSEYAAFAYGTTEATSSGGTDVPTTGVSGTGATSAWNLFTSKFGIIQASGCMWIWGDEFGGGAAAAGYVANTQSRGSTYQMENAVIFGGYWGGAANSGSRASYWADSATGSSTGFGARGVCDHLTLV